MATRRCVAAFTPAFIGLIVIALSFPCSTLHGQSRTRFHIAKRIAIGGEGGWDYLNYDVQTHRLFVSHGTHAVVVNADSGTVIGRIDKTEGIHGIAIANDLGRGYTSNGRTANVSVFNLSTFSTIKEIATDNGPDAILYEPNTHRVFTFNGRSENATVIDAQRDSAIATLPLDGAPEFAVTDGKGTIFVNMEDKNEVVAFDAASLKIKARWPLAPGDSPTGLAIDVEHHRLFSVCRNKFMIVLNSDNGHVLATLPIGSGVDGCAFDPGLQLAFASNGEGTITVVKEETPDNFTVLETVTTERGARTISLDSVTHRLFLPTAEFGPAPAPTQEHQRPRASVRPNTFVVLQVQR